MDVAGEYQTERKYGYPHRIGEDMIVYFLDGQNLKRKLVKAFQYEIIFEVSKEVELLEVMVFKGAVKYIV